jgi:hypothetical protein
MSENHAAAESPLSIAHISLQPEKAPSAEWFKGSSYLKVSRGGSSDIKGGGKRNGIKGFSSASRRRLMQTIAKVRRDAELPLFVTLTYPGVFPGPKASKTHLDALNKRIARAFPNAGYIWKLEPQQRGAPHFHILLWGVPKKEFRTWLPVAWFGIAGAGDEKHLKWHKGELGNGNTHCVQQVKSFRGVWAYAAKYLGKTFEIPGWEAAGRFWAVVRRDNIPFGEAQTALLDRPEACTILRYQRRVMKKQKASGKRKKHNSRSAVLYCDVNQWVEKLNLESSISSSTGMIDAAILLGGVQSLEMSAYEKERLEQLFKTINTASHLAESPPTGAG